MSTIKDNRENIFQLKRAYKYFNNLYISCIKYTIKWECFSSFGRVLSSDIMRMSIKNINRENR